MLFRNTYIGGQIIKKSKDIIIMNVRRIVASGEKDWVVTGRGTQRLEGTGEKVSEEEGASDLPISCDTAVHIRLLLLSGASRVRLRAVVTASEHLSWWTC